MPPARAARPDPGAADGAAAPLLARLEVAAEAGEVDVRQLAELVGVTAGALRAALARPALLNAEQAATVARTLGVDAATMRALRRTSDGDSPGSAHASTPGPHAAAPSTLDLLDRVLRAVRGDAAGLALRAAVLDVAAEAARAAGRPLPPGAHALRARLATPGGGESTAGGGTADDVPEGEPDDPSPEAAAADAAALVRDLQRTAPGYDDLFAPLHDDALADLLARHALAVHAAPGVPAGTRTVLTPPLVGRRRLVLAAAATADQRRLALRAALAACAAGHAADDRPLASPAPRAVALVTDVAALADLVPFWQVADLRRRGRLGWRALAAHVAEVAAALARDWPPPRAADAGTARVALFRHHEL